jgi:hypothetical protein
MRIPDADPEGRNHADSCGCGSATLPVSNVHKIEIHLLVWQQTYGTVIDTEPNGIESVQYGTSAAEISSKKNNFVFP